MAYRRYSRYKRRYARKGNRGYSYSNRRRFHRSRYRRYRRYRRRINRKIEYKRIEGTVMYNFSTSSQKVSDLNRYFQIINPYPYGVYCIGYKSSNHPLAFPGVYIDSGTSINQRIGLKISPVKLRIFGAVNILHKDNVPGESAPSEYIGQQVTQRIHLRLIVLQVRNGNTDYYPDQEEFSSVNPYVTQLDDQTIYNNFNDVHYYLDEGFFGRMFSKVATMTAVTRAVGDHHVNWHGYDLATNSDAFGKMLI